MGTGESSGKGRGKNWKRKGTEEEEGTAPANVGSWKGEKKGDKKGDKKGEKKGNHKCQSSSLALADQCALYKNRAACPWNGGIPA